MVKMNFERIGILANPTLPDVMNRRSSVWYIDMFTKIDVEAMLYHTSKIEGDWVLTYDRKGKLISMILADEAHKRICWFLRDPYDLMTEYEYVVSEDIANSLVDFLEGKYIDTYYFFHSACYDKKKADEIIKWMMGPLKEIMVEQDIKKLPLRFQALDFGKLMKDVIEKTITATMGKDILRRMFDGESIDELLADDKYEISSDDEAASFIKQVIEANPNQVEELKAGKEKLLPWLVGQVMRVSKGKVNAAEVKEMLITELELEK